ncbi:hypothetical protein Nepgr_011582 [Nepenthes gracilis]|uniref:Uncharacterized protein n=1 Tax=Nepenthes gracilis TaxID=150966 RepID=A0AAD3SFD8_NEPGR|nr:hypothetical protein Nepgr_011582 [Nepenthes gracilis]
MKYACVCVEVDFGSVFPSKIRIGLGTYISLTIEVDVSYQWKPKRMNIDSHIEGRFLSIPSTLIVNPVSEDPQKQLKADPALKVSLGSTGPESGTACASDHCKFEGIRELGTENSSLVEPGVVLDQIKLPTNQLDGNMVTHFLRQCTPLFVSPRPLNDVSELEVSGDSGVDISSPPGDVHEEEAFKALSSSGGVSFVCLTAAIPVEEEVFTKNGSTSSREGEDHDNKLVVDSQAPLSDAVTSFDDRTSSGAEIEDHDSIVPPSDEAVSKMAPAPVVDLDQTPSSITCLLSKYSLDISNIGGPITISPRGSLADVSQDRAQEASKRQSFYLVFVAVCSPDLQDLKRVPLGWVLREYNATFLAEK